MSPKPLENPGSNNLLYCRLSEYTLKTGKQILVSEFREGETQHRPTPFGTPGSARPRASLDLLILPPQLRFAEVWKKFAGDGTKCVSSGLLLWRKSRTLALDHYRLRGVREAAQRLNIGDPRAGCP